MYQKFIIFFIIKFKIFKNIFKIIIKKSNFISQEYRNRLHTTFK